MNDSSRIVHRLLLRASLSFAQLFAWIFVFQYFFTLSGSLEYATVSLALTYALTQVITILLTPVAASGLRNGYRGLMLFSVFVLASAFTLLSISFADIISAAGITAFAILMGVYRAFYWAPYRVAAEKDPQKKPIWTEYLLAILPLLAGFLLDGGTVSAVILLGIAAAVALLSGVPLFSMRDAHEGFAWGYRETFHQLYIRAHRRATLSSILHGIEMSLMLIVWPIIVFVILGWSYALLGIVLSVIYIFSILIRGMVKRPMMQLSRPTRALYAASAWIMRLGVGGSVGIILIDVYYHGGSHASLRGYDMMTHEHAADNTTYIDEYTALKEIAMAIGRLGMALLVAFLASNMSVTYTFGLVFLLAAVASATSILLSGKKARA